jgi:hypothetical protein
MKKLLSLVLTAVCILSMALCLVSCQEKELQFDKEYVYTDISFKKADDLTLDDIRGFIPVGSSIETVKDFENLLRENIETYYIERLTESGLSERMHIRPSILSVRITEGHPYMTNAYSLWLKSEFEEKEVCYGVIRNGDVFTCPDPMIEFIDFYYSGGKLHYDLEFNDKFSIVYNFK